MGGRSDFIVRLQDVSKHFDAINALRGESIEIGAGEAVGPTGDNGAERSTAKIRTGVTIRLLDDFMCVLRHPARSRLDANGELRAMLSSYFGQAVSLGLARSRGGRCAGGPKDPSHGR